MPARGSRGPRGAYSYALYERISDRCFAFVQAPASFRFASSSETTMNFQGWMLSADTANRAAFTTAWTFCSGTGSGLYLLTLFTDLMASKASISSRRVDLMW